MKALRWYALNGERILRPNMRALLPVNTNALAQAMAAELTPTADQPSQVRMFG